MKAWAKLRRLEFPDVVGAAGTSLTAAGAWGLWGPAVAALVTGGFFVALWVWIELRPRRRAREE